MSGSLSGNRSRKLGSYQFRPDQVPVVRAKVAAGYLAVRNDLDSGASLGWYWANARNPLIDGYGRNANAKSKLCLTSARFARLLNRCFFHASIIRRCLTIVNRNFLSVFVRGNKVFQGIKE